MVHLVDGRPVLVLEALQVLPEVDLPGVQGVVDVVHLHPLQLRVVRSADAVRQQRTHDADEEGEAETATGARQDAVVLHGVDEEQAQAALVHGGGAQSGDDPRRQTAQTTCTTTRDKSPQTSVEILCL